MLILLAVITLGVFLFSRMPRLEKSPDVRSYMEAPKPVVRAYVDVKPVKSYLKD